MRRGIITSFAVLAAWWGAGANFAAAQFGTLGQQPRINPGVNSPLTPRLNTTPMPYNPARSSDWYIAQRLSQDNLLLGQPAGSGTATTGFQTGHGVTFLDYAGYFPIDVPTGTFGSLGSQTSPAAGSLGSPLQGLGSQGRLPTSLTATGTQIGFMRR